MRATNLQAIKALKKLSTKTHKTMKKENPCFFSVSLENGITITGENPNIVKDFILNMQIAASDCSEAALTRGHHATSEEMDYYEQILRDAYLTIINNLNK